MRFANLSGRLIDDRTAPGRQHATGHPAGRTVCQTRLRD
jgi:YD repeat-containing protein